MCCECDECAKLWAMVMNDAAMLPGGGLCFAKVKLHGGPCVTLGQCGVCKGVQAMCEEKGRAVVGSLTHARGSGGCERPGGVCSSETHTTTHTDDATACNHDTCNDERWLHEPAGGTSLRVLANMAGKDDPYGGGHAGGRSSQLTPSTTQNKFEGGYKEST